MGMFDDVTFAPGLLPPETPTFARKPGYRFQTKDFDHPSIDRYHVTADGRLEKYERTADGEKRVGEIPYHGDIDACAGNSVGGVAGHAFTLNGEDYEWIDLTLRFTNGQLERITIKTAERHPALPMTHPLFWDRTATPATIAAALAERDATA
jgi:hypothetical protein